MAHEDKGEKVKVPATVVSAFEGLSNSDVVKYVNYWEDLTARDEMQLFQRFLFAYCSVHTTWESNVAGYNAIKDYSTWRGSRANLRDHLVRVGAGLHNNRSKWIDEFGAKYWADPKAFQRGNRESWPCYRSRLAGCIAGLGPAKVSFALELAYPLEAEVLCLDVHMLRAYGKQTQSLRSGEYELYEADWVARSRAIQVPPFVVKQIYWDAKQNRPDSRYWSHVLE